MINPDSLPTWSEIFVRLGEQEPRNNRARCLIHGGTSRYSLGLNEERGLFHCFVCNAAGDKIDFIKEVQGTDFKGALTFLGRQNNALLLLADPCQIKRQKAISEIRYWCDKKGRKLRDEYYSRQIIERYCRQLCVDNQEHEQIWELLRIAYVGESKNEWLLDEIDLCRTDAERLAVWRKYRNEF